MNKTAKVKYCREILKSYYKNTIPEDEAEKLIEIFKEHPDWEEKAGPGVERIESNDMVWNGYKKTKCFYLYRKDNTKTHISFHVAINGYTKKSQVIEKLRLSIKHQVYEFRNESFKKSSILICPISGEEVTKENVHIDHKYPFISLVNDWMESTNLTFEDIKENHIKDFADYHKIHATLQATTPEANLKKSASKS